MLMQFESFRDADRLASQLWNGALPQRAMLMDAYRDGNDYVVHFDMPVVDPASIDVTVEKNVLTVKIPLAETTQPRRIAVSGGGKDGSKVAPAVA